MCYNCQRSCSCDPCECRRDTNKPKYCYKCKHDPIYTTRRAAARGTRKVQAKAATTRRKK